MEQRFNQIVYRLKLLNYSIDELLQLNISKVHEQILYNDHERLSNEKDNLMVHGVNLKDDKYFKDFFNRYEEHFRIKSDVVPEKIEAKPLLKG